MQGFIITLLTCSMTMSMLVLFYMATTPLLEKRYSAKGRYYAWLVIVVGLIIPFRPQFTSAIVKVDMPSETVTPMIQIGNGMPVAVPVNTTVLPPSLPSVSIWYIVFAIWPAGERSSKSVWRNGRDFASRCVLTISLIMSAAKRP